VGAPPAFVLEIASEKTVKVDVRDKPAKYLAMGVGEYWRFDPSGGELLQPALQGERRVGDAWRPIIIGLDDGGLLSGHSRALGLTLHAHGHRLRFCDPHTGTWLPDPDEQAARAEEEVQARHAAETRATAAEARADQQAAAAAAARGPRPASGGRTRGPAPAPRGAVEASRENHPIVDLIASTWPCPANCAPAPTNSRRAASMTSAAPAPSSSATGTCPSG